MKLLKMKLPYIVLTSKHLKTATTRLKFHPCGDYELVSGSRYKPLKSGVKIRIKEIWGWTLATITDEQKEKILYAENIDTWAGFIGVLENLNSVLLEQDTVLYTHFYKMIE